MGTNVESNFERDLSLSFGLKSSFVAWAIIFPENKYEIISYTQNGRTIAIQYNILNVDKGHRNTASNFLSR